MGRRVGGASISLVLCVGAIWRGRGGEGGATLPPTQGCVNLSSFESHTAAPGFLMKIPKQTGQQSGGVRRPKSSVDLTCDLLTVRLLLNATLYVLYFIGIVLKLFFLDLIGINPEFSLF